MNLNPNALRSSIKDELQKTQSTIANLKLVFGPQTQTLRHF